MKNKLLTLLFIFLSTAIIFAQTTIIKGKITNKNGIPLEYASIGLIGTTIGTVSNSEGVFIFKIPEKYKNNTLRISMLGYKSYNIPLSEINNYNLKIRLSQITFKISEVKVKPKDAKKIIRKVIEKIPVNYPVKAINMEGFYREMTFENDTCVEFAEAACNFYYRPYNEIYNKKEAWKKSASEGNTNFENYYVSPNMFKNRLINPKDKTQIIEARASDLHHKHRFKVVPFGGPSSLSGYDYTKQFLLFKSQRYLKEYKLKFLGVTEYNGNRVYKIKAEHTPLIYKISGTAYYDILFVDIDSYALVAVEYNYYTYDFKRTSYWTPALYKKRKKRCKDIERQKYYRITTKYKKIGKKWYLNYIKTNFAFDYIFSKYYIYKKTEPKISYSIQRELLINKIKTTDVKDIPDSIIFTNRFFNTLYENDLAYNKSFWKNYNTIALTPVQDSIIKQLEKYRSIEKQYADKFTKNDNLKAPAAEKIPSLNQNTNINDNYYWMQDLKNPKVLQYAENENNYTKNFMLPLKQTQRNLFLEMIKRHKNDTIQIRNKIKNGEYEYFFKKEKYANYSNIYRKKTGNSSKEELVLDIIKKAHRHPVYWAKTEYISSDNSIFAYREPITDGYDSQIIFKNLNTGKNIDSLYRAGNINSTKNKNELLYTSWDKTNRIDKLFLHKSGTKQKNDRLIYYEKNKLNEIKLSLYDKKYLLLESSNDFYYNNFYSINLSKKNIELKEIVPYKEGFSYFIKIQNDTLFSLTNEPEGKTVLYYSDMNTPEQKYWKKIIQNTGNSFFSTYLILKKYIVLIEKENMQTRFRIIDKNGNTIKILKFDDEETYTIGFEHQDNLSENTFRYFYTSLATPKKTFEYNIENNKTAFIKQKHIEGYIAKNYKTKLLWATSKDGVKVPVSIVYNKKRVKRNGKAPVLLTAYGSYGANLKPTFLSARLSLIDRGIIYAIAHVRGGSELGEKWHENAMQLKKKNTFYDFIACTEQLIKEKYTAKGKIVAFGESAGGLTIGESVNIKSDLFNTVILGSPYLDILNTLTDTTAKFNSIEKGELGDPAKNKVLKYIKSYSPYENITAQNYPNLLFLCGLNDTRIAYWHTLKSVAKLRCLKTDTNTLLLKTDLYAGHNSYSGTYNYISLEAFIYTFILHNLGIKY